jgi:uncharacterized membrane protein
MVVRRLDEATHVTAASAPTRPLPIIGAMSRTSTHLLRLFITGLLAALPLAATIGLFWWFASVLLRWVGPDSAVGSVLKSLGLGVGGSEVVGYLIGLGLVGAGFLLLGALVELELQRSLGRLVNAVLNRIPVVRSVYQLIQRMVALLSQRDEQGVRSMSPVWCHFGGPGGEPQGSGHAAVLALLSSPQPVMVAGRACLAVLVPTAPVPVGGGLMYVPREWVTPAELGMEALTSIYVSMGVTSGQYLAAAPAPSSQAGAAVAQAPLSGP